MWAWPSALLAGGSHLLPRATCSYSGSVLSSKVKALAAASSQPAMSATLPAVPAAADEVSVCSCILCLFAWIPGIIHALYVCL